MLTGLAQSVYNAHLEALAPGAGGPRARKLRRLRRFLLKWGDPDIVVQLDGAPVRTPFSSNILLAHAEFPFYDRVLPRLAAATGKKDGRLAMVDVGANIGLATLLVSRQFAGQFLCVEPNPRFKACLDHNLKGIKGAAARFVALSAKKGALNVRQSYSEGNSSIETGPGGAPLEFITLDELLAAQAGCQAPNIIKIDTEGYELKVLLGAEQTLVRHKPILFFEYFPDLIKKQGDSPEALFELLRGHGYGPAIFYDGGGCLLTPVRLGEEEKVAALRRYCRLHHSFFDIVVFPESESAFHDAFLREETKFFEARLNP